MSSKRYPEEFRTKAVKQVVDRGHSVSSVATSLNIREPLGKRKLSYTKPVF